MSDELLETSTRGVVLKLLTHRQNSDASRVPDGELRVKTGSTDGDQQRLQERIVNAARDMLAPTILTDE